MRNDQRQRTMWLAALGVVVLLMIASGAGIFRNFDATPISSNQAAQRATIGAIVGALLVGAAVLVARRTGSAAQMVTAAFGTATIVAFAALLITAVAAGGASTASDPPPVRAPDRAPTQEQQSPGTVETIPPFEDVEADTSANYDLGWIVTLFKLALFGLAVFAACWLWSKRRRRPTKSSATAPLDPTFAQPVEPELLDVDNEAAAESFASSVRALLDGDDARSAIIAAYAALLEGLEAAGAGRRPHEAPEEHLRRSLVQLRIPSEALAEVTRLFLVAKFSSHPMGEADRERARAMLDVAEQHLRALATIGATSGR